MEEPKKTRSFIWPVLMIAVGIGCVCLGLVIAGIPGATVGGVVGLGALFS